MRSPPSVWIDLAVVGVMVAIFAGAIAFAWWG